MPVSCAIRSSRLSSVFGCTCSSSAVSRRARSLRSQQRTVGTRSGDGPSGTRSSASRRRAGPGRAAWYSRARSSSVYTPLGHWRVRTSSRSSSAWPAAAGSSRRRWAGTLTAVAAAPAAATSCATVRRVSVRPGSRGPIPGRSSTPPDADSSAIDAVWPGSRSTALRTRLAFRRAATSLLTSWSCSSAFSWKWTATTRYASASVTPRRCASGSADSPLSNRCTRACEAEPSSCSMERRSST